MKIFADGASIYNKISGSIKKPIRAMNANYQAKGSHMVVERYLGTSPISDKPLSNFAIVVVEDHDDTRRSLGIFLGHLGANVVMARNAFEGVEAVKTGRLDRLEACAIKVISA